MVFTSTALLARVRRTAAARTSGERDVGAASREGAPPRPSADDARRSMLLGDPLRPTPLRGLSVALSSGSWLARRVWTRRYSRLPVATREPRSESRPRRPLINLLQSPRWWRCCCCALRVLLALGLRVLLALGLRVLLALGLRLLLALELEPVELLCRRFRDR